MSNTPDTTQLPALIRLLEDESIRSSVMGELVSYGPALEEEIERQGIPLSTANALLIRLLLAQHYRDWVVRNWRPWFRKRKDKSRLEAALDVLGQFQLGRLYPAKLRTTLDSLADEYDARYAQRNPIDLSEFLFQGYGLRGVEQDAYYNPLNSSLVYVIEQKRGIPISLACIYILVGDRLGLNIEGCNFPGHFLAVASTSRQKVIVDCFNGGTFINEESLSTVNARITRADILGMQCNAQTIIVRVLHNLINAYGKEGDEENAEIMGRLLFAAEELV